MIVRFTPEADAELAEARQWYAHQREDLDLEFMQSVDEALSRIVSNPNLYPIVYLNSEDAPWFAVFRSRFFMKLSRTKSRSWLSSIRDAIWKAGSREFRRRWIAVDPGTALATAPRTARGGLDGCRRLSSPV